MPKAVYRSGCHVRQCSQSSLGYVVKCGQRCENAGAVTGRMRDRSKGLKVRLGE